MNLNHLRYAVEVDRARSISKAAETLYMGQPNLSRAIRELEESLGISLFTRTPKGIMPTPQGQQFLARARDILAQVDEMETLFLPDTVGEQALSIVLPRAGYAVAAVAALAAATSSLAVSCREANPLQAITLVAGEEYRMGILHIDPAHARYFGVLLAGKGLVSRELGRLPLVALLPRDHAALDAATLSPADLANGVEIAFGDPYAPCLPPAEAKKSTWPSAAVRRLTVFDRAAQYDLLTAVPTAYAWSVPLPTVQLDRLGLTQRPCAGQREVLELLVLRRQTRLTAAEQRLLDTLAEGRRAASELYHN